jgi:cytochrome c553
LRSLKGHWLNPQRQLQTCIGCHGIVGYKASFPTVYPVPKIGGQNAKYIESALQAYKAGDRSHPTMRGIAGSLSDQDMADLAAYYSASATTAVASTQPASK